MRGRKATSLRINMQSSLPIHPYREQIVSTIRDNNVVIIEAETGAGKSTWIPRFLLEEGYEVVVTQPRRLAARALAMHVAKELGVDLGDLVGYQTADEKRMSTNTRLLFCTDGLRLIQEVTSTFVSHKILVIDEVHEWNRDIETLVAWVKLRLTQDEDFRFVLMSATMETEPLSKFFDDCPVVRVPGRTFPVQRVNSDDYLHAATELLRHGRNVLLFLPGISEIMWAKESFEGRGIDREAEIVLLHGGLSPQDQDLAFRSYDRPKLILSTNIAQTSVTIDDVNAVVDTGLEKRIEVRNGIEGLHISEISQADCDQRAGRAGRTQDGIYVLCSSFLYGAREQFSLAEVFRSRLEQLVLRLSDAGFEAEELKFFHQPEAESFMRARLALHHLGALEDNQITEVGKAMVHLPVDVHVARMIVEAQKLAVVPEVLTIAACLEAGGIRFFKRGTKGHWPWQALTAETTSDLLAELDCFNAALELDSEERSELGVHGKNFRQALELRRKLSRLVGETTSSGIMRSREATLRACVTGMVDNLYRHQSGRTYSNISGQDVRQLDRRSVVWQADWLAGIPFDLSTRNSQGKTINRQLIQWATKVDLAWFPKFGEVSMVPNSGRPRTRGGRLKPLTELQEVLGIVFDTPNLLELAFTHRSYLNEARGQAIGHFERLEFLGDAVLEYVTTQYLLRTFPGLPEGELTGLRSSLVSTESLLEVSSEFGLVDYAAFSRGEAKNRSQQFKVAADLVESLIGAIHEDQGLEQARSFIETHILSRLPKVIQGQSWIDSVSLLQEIVQDDDGQTPQYKTIESRGPDHASVHTVGVYKSDTLMATGEGQSIKMGRVAAAKAALETHYADRLDAYLSQRSRAVKMAVESSEFKPEQVLEVVSKKGHTQINQKTSITREERPRA